MNKKLLAAFLVCGLTLTGCANSTEKKAEETKQTTKEDDHGSVEWIGQYEFEAGKEYGLAFDKSKDKSVMVSFTNLESKIEELDHHVEHVMGSKPEEIKLSNHDIDVKNDYAYKLELKEDTVHYHITVPKTGKYAVGLEHAPKELNFKIVDDKDKEVPIISEQTIDGNH